MQDNFEGVHDNPHRLFFVSIKMVSQISNSLRLLNATEQDGLGSLVFEVLISPFGGAAAKLNSLISIFIDEFLVFSIVHLVLPTPKYFSWINRMLSI